MWNQAPCCKSSARRGKAANRRVDSPLKPRFADVPHIGERAHREPAEWPKSECREDEWEERHGHRGPVGYGNALAFGNRRNRAEEENGPERRQPIAVEPEA